MNLAWRHQLTLLVVAIAALAAAFLRPQATLPHDTYRYVYTFDISQSMNVEDVTDAGEPVSRLTLAKRRATGSLTTLPCGAEVGIALFTGHRVFLLLLPVEICENYTELKTIIASIDWRMTWEARSEVAKGLYKGHELMTLLPHETRLVFFTDGHEAPPLHPEVQPKFRGRPGAVKGLVVGVGGDAPVPIPKFNADGAREGYWTAAEVLHMDEFSLARLDPEDPARATGSEHLSSLRADYLGEIATQTGLDYVRLESAYGFTTALERPAYGIERFGATDLRPFFAALALLLVLLTLVGSVRADATRTGRDHPNH